jgi:hypothetical protein
MTNRVFISWTSPLCARKEHKKLHRCVQQEGKKIRLRRRKPRLMMVTMADRKDVQYT